MRKTIFLLVAVVALVAFRFAPKQYVVNAGASKVAWLAKKVTGEHNGLVAIQQGELSLDGGKLVGGSFTIDMNSITCLDIENEAYNTKFVTHLKSDDFFGTATHPTAKLVIKKVEAKGDNNYAVTGDLTIKGITNEIGFDANVAENGGKVNATANIVVNRAKYDIKYRSGSFFDGLGDKMIYDEFTLTVNLEANAK